MASEVLMEHLTEGAAESFTRAAEFATAARVLFWFKETGDNLRNKDRLSPAQMAQRKMILDMAHAVIAAERDHSMEHFFQSIDYRNREATKELKERLDESEIKLVSGDTERAQG